jgi:hypothetical protein
MTSNSKGDMLRVDGPTRDAIIEALRDRTGKSARQWHEHTDAADFIKERFPVSAEPDSIEWC